MEGERLWVVIAFLVVFTLIVVGCVIVALEMKGVLVM